MRVCTEIVRVVHYGGRHVRQVVVMEIVARLPINFARHAFSHDEQYTFIITCIVEKIIHRIHISVHLRV